MSFSFKSHGMTDEEIVGHNESDVDGDPAGGNAQGRGLDIDWQDGPIDRDAGEQPNGTLVEDVLEVCKRRLEFYQDSRFACEENDAALNFIKRAIAACLARRKDRAARGVLGKHEV